MVALLIAIVLPVSDVLQLHPSVVLTGCDADKRHTVVMCFVQIRLNFEAKPGELFFFGRNNPLWESAEREVEARNQRSYLEVP